ncbi:MAG: SDR family NAD(P)-dependent oxidoreductase [Candidatus Nanopelagicales bacterium]
MNRLNLPHRTRSSQRSEGRSGHLAELGLGPREEPESEPRPELEILVDPKRPGLAELVAAARAPLGDRVALVTGATRGAGRAISESLLLRGWRVAALGRNVPALRELAAGARDSTVLPLVADVTDEIAMTQACAALTALWRPPDLVVANAGVYQGFGPVWEVDPAAWWGDFEVNIRGVFHTLRGVLPGMIARGGGQVVVMSSGMGSRPQPFSSAYGGSKAAVTHLVSSVAGELQGTGVSIFAVSPGTLRTQMTQWPESLLKLRPDLADPPPSAYFPMWNITELISDLASGRFDALTGRFLHVKDDREAMLTQIESGGRS